ncbi:MAG TPA: hypothetical protein PLU35_05515 [Phycisphaerales bacterium]|nr:hypothetical protein [Phycisphaerales bacterium]
MPDEPHTPASARALRFVACSPCAIVLMCIVAVAVLWPAGWALVGVVRGVLDAGAGDLAITRVRAVALARSVAWGLRSARSAWAPLLLAPMLLPNYLAYAGWNLLRAPGGVLAGVVDDALQRGATWAPIAMGRAFAWLGLVLWVWPVAAVVLAIAARRIDRAVLDALALEPMRGWRRAALIVSATRWGWVGAAGCAALLTLASPVPLHVANVPTYAVEVVWFSLDFHPFAERWRSWASAWPLVAVALLAGVAIAGPVARAASARTGGEATDDRPRVGAFAWCAAGTVWSLSVAVPFVLLARDAGTLRAIANTARTIAPAAASSGAWAAIAGATAVIVAACVASIAGSRRRADRWLVACALASWLAAALMPGVLIGSAVDAAYGRAPLVGGSIVVVAVGEVARFGFLGVLIGCVLARLQPRALADLRRLDGAEGVRGWWRVARPMQAGALAGVGLATGALAFHEVEAASQLQPPGLGGLATLMLNFLHFARQSDLSAASVMLIVVGLALGIGALVLTARVTRHGA